MKRLPGPTAVRLFGDLGHCRGFEWHGIADMSHRRGSPLFLVSFLSNPFVRAGIRQRRIVSAWSTDSSQLKSIRIEGLRQKTTHSTLQRRVVTSLTLRMHMCIHRIVTIKIDELFELHILTETERDRRRAV